MPTPRRRVGGRVSKSLLKPQSFFALLFSALAADGIVVIKEDIPADETRDFQMFVNRLLEYEGLGTYKNICFNPNDKVAVEGFNPRSLSPYFMVNIASRKVLGKAARTLRKTNYYDRLPDEYLSFLKVKLKQKGEKCGNYGNGMAGISKAKR